MVSRRYELSSMFAMPPMMMVLYAQFTTGFFLYDDVNHTHLPSQTASWV